MDLADFLLVRCRAARTLRTLLRDPKVSFGEMALLCHLDLAKASQRVSDLASYEGVIRPTMSHRLQRLARLGLVEQARGEEDRRSVLYGLSERGRWQVEDFLEATAQAIAPPDPLASVSPERLGRYVEAAGCVPASASDLVLLALEVEGRPLRVTDLQRRTGLIQPTCSVTLATLEGRGLVERLAPGEDPALASGAGTVRAARLTPSGAEAASRLAARVRSVVVHR